MKTNILYDTKYYFQQNKKKIQKDSLGGGVLHAQLLNQQEFGLRHLKNQRIRCSSPHKFIMKGTKAEEMDAEL